MSRRQRRDLARLEKLSGRLWVMVKNGSFSDLPAPRRRKLLARIRRLYARLRDGVGEEALRSVMATCAAIIIGTAGCTDSHGRTGDFDSTTSPDDGPDAVHDVSDATTDPAHDSILEPDLPVGPIDPVFAPPVLNPFGLEALPDGCSFMGFPAFADLDADGNHDLLVGTFADRDRGCLVYYENTGTRTSASFASAISEPFGLEATGVVIVPAFGDMDGDGDLDLFAGSGTYGGYSYGHAEFLYYENTGTSSAPSFAPASASPFGLAGEEWPVIAPACADIDKDGDLDVLVSVGHYYYTYSHETFRFHENVGGSTSPAFAEPVFSPFGIVSEPDVAPPSLADIDIDGDLDLLAGTLHREGFEFFENVGSSASPAFSESVWNPFGLVTSYYYSLSPALVDIDGDGDIDLFAGAGERIGFVFFENTSI